MLTNWLTDQQHGSLTDILFVNLKGMGLRNSGLLLKHVYLDYIKKIKLIKQHEIATSPVEFQVHEFCLLEI